MAFDADGRTNNFTLQRTATLACIVDYYANSRFSTTWRYDG